MFQNRYRTRLDAFVRYTPTRTTNIPAVLIRTSDKEREGFRSWLAQVSDGRHVDDETFDFGTRKVYVVPPSLDHPSIVCAVLHVDAIGPHLVEALPHGHVHLSTCMSGQCSHGDGWRMFPPAHRFMPMHRFTGAMSTAVVEGVNHFSIVTSGAQGIARIVAGVVESSTPCPC